MHRWTPPLPPTAPQPWQSRAQILKSHLDSLPPDELMRVRPDYWTLRFGPSSVVYHGKALHPSNYDPNQPRVPAGNPEGGQWIAALMDKIGDIISYAKRFNIAASPGAYQRCLNLCYRLLERPQSPGSDRNTWDFHKCMNACLGRNL